MNLSAMRDELVKIAQDAAASDVPEEGMAQNPEPLPPHPLLTAAKGGLGFGVGALGGFLATKGVDAALRKIVPGHAGLPTYMNTLVPVLTGVGGIAAAHAQNTTLDKMREDTQRRRELLRERKGT